MPYVLTVEYMSANSVRFTSYSMDSSRTQCNPMQPYGSQWQSIEGNFILQIHLVSVSQLNCQTVALGLEETTN